MGTLTVRRALVPGLWNLPGGRKQNSKQAENEVYGTRFVNYLVAFWIMNKNKDHCRF
jgi:hypothetical protein